MSRLENIVSLYPLTIIRAVYGARELINADVSNHIILKELARRAGTNECTLKKGFKDIFQITVYQYLLARRMQYASHLLKTTRLKEREIAFRCGFESLAGFITTFKRTVGCSPGTLRKQGATTDT